MSENGSDCPVKCRRVHSRVDELIAKMGEIHSDVKALRVSCQPCRKLVEKHERLMMEGSNGDGMLTEVAIMRRNWRSVKWAFRATALAVLSLAVAILINTMGW